MMLRQNYINTFINLQGTLNWYSIDHWSNLLDIDIIKLHQMERAKIQYLPGAENFPYEIKTHDIRVTFSY